MKGPSLLSAPLDATWLQYLSLIPTDGPLGVVSDAMRQAIQPLKDLGVEVAGDFESLIKTLDTIYSDQGQWSCILPHDIRDRGDVVSGDGTTEWPVVDKRFPGRKIVAATVWVLRYDDDKGGNYGRDVESLYGDCHPVVSSIIIAENMHIAIFDGASGPMAISTNRGASHARDEMLRIRACAQAGSIGHGVIWAGLSRCTREFLDHEMAEDAAEWTFPSEVGIT